MAERNERVEQLLRGHVDAECIELALDVAFAFDQSVTSDAVAALRRLSCHLGGKLERRVTLSEATILAEEIVRRHMLAADRKDQSGTHTPRSTQ